MTVLSFYTPKGGAGKTTAVTAIASVLSQKKIPVSVIDCDPAHPIVAWHKAVQSAYIKLTSNDTAQTLLADMEEARRKAKITLIDLEGTRNKKATIAIAASDLTVIPCNPSALDAKQVMEAVRFIRSLEAELEQAIPHVVLFSRMHPAFKFKSFEHIRNSFAKLGIDMLPSAIIERRAFEHMFSLPRALHEIDEKAFQNSATVTARLFEKINDLNRERPA